MRKLTLILVALLTVFVSFNACAQKKSNKKMNTITLTMADFKAKVANPEASEWKYLGDKPAIIDFYATWCGPCKALAPILDEVAGEYKDKIYVYKVDTDQEPELAALFGIRSIPTLIYIPMEGKPSSTVGARSKKDLVEMINNTLLK